MGYYTVKLLDEKEYGFEAFVAPANFDRTAQEVDIYEKFKVLNSMDETASWIFSCTSAIQVVLPAVTNVSYRYAETINGVEIISNKIASGTVFTPGSTKRWVCGYYIGTTNTTVSLPKNSVWVYIWDSKINSISEVEVNSLTTYIHFNKLSKLTEIGYHALYYSNLTGVLTIPPEITTIPRQAFRANTKITSIVFNSKLTNISEFAFSECTGITGTLNLPEGLQSIGVNAFNMCSMTSITIPSTLTTIGNLAFSRETAMNNITNIQVSGSNWVVSDSILYNSTYTRIIISLGTKTNAITMPNTVTSIDGEAFASQNVSGNVTWSNSLISIGDSAFYNCKYLTGSITLPNTITSIGSSCFQYCYRFTSLSLPNTPNYTTISGYCFAYCTGLLGDLIIPQYITALAIQCFREAMFNGTLTINNTNISIGSNVFYGDSSFATLNLPVGYSSSFLDFSFSQNYTADSLNQSIINIASGTKTLTIGTTNKTRLVAAYPNAETNANLRGITIV